MTFSKYLIAGACFTISLGFALDSMAEETQCATLYRKENANDKSSYEVIYPKSEYADLRDIYLYTHPEQNWDNLAMSAKVNAGCTLTVFQYSNYNVHNEFGQEMEGVKQVLKADRSPQVFNFAAFNLDKKVSSLTCYCN